MEDERGHANAAGREAGDDVGRKRPSSAGHLGRSRFGGVHVLVGGDRPRALDVPVADRTAVSREIVVKRIGQLEADDPEPHTAGVAEGREEARRPPAGRRSTSPDTASRHGSVPRRSSAVQRPAGRAVDRCTSTASPALLVAVTLAASVPDVLTTTRSPSRRKRGSSENVAVPERAFGAPRDDHAHGVAGEYRGFWRCPGLESGR